MNHYIFQRCHFLSAKKTDSFMERRGMYHMFPAVSIIFVGKEGCPRWIFTINRLRRNILLITVLRVCDGAFVALPSS